ncbi:hypothetical protein evm_015221 [Chilo suppressalis]|nr:hypothetical protein evm_015221 [Chilo suppressalis]
MDANNLNKQKEEVVALSSIYGKDWTAEGTATYHIRIKEGNKEVLLYVTMPPDYPTLSPPKYEMSAPWMDRKAKWRLNAELDAVYYEHIGETVVYQWIEAVREYLQSMKTTEPDRKAVNKVTKSLEALEIKCPEITHGEVIIDRKSIFQGHAAEVHDINEVFAVMAKLKQNKKISHAKHNMYAYRIERKTTKGTTIIQDCDEDGEAQAGGRMMHLMNILDQKNTLVVVTRWYGGIQLGPDRFRHITNAARQAIQQAGLLKKKLK